MNTFDDDNDPEFFEPRTASLGGGGRRPQRGGPRRSGPPSHSDSVLRLAALIAVAIAVVLLLVLWMASCSGGSTESYSAYIRAMQPLAQDSASVGKEFSSALGTPGLTAGSFTADLNRWSKQQLDDYIAAQRLSPPGLLQSANAEALSAFQLRAAALAGIANTITLAKAAHDSAFVAGAALAHEAQLFTASDVIWERLFLQPATKVLASEGVTGVIVPPSQIVTDPGLVSLQALATVYQRVGTTSSGGKVTGIHGMALVGTNAVDNGVSTSLSTSSTTTVAVGSNLVINVVVENSGNYPEVRIPVTLTVKVSGQNVYTKTESIAQLAARARATVPFHSLQLPPSAFGHDAFISVTDGKVLGEAKLENNAATYPVFFQLAP